VWHFKARASDGRSQQSNLELFLISLADSYGSALAISALMLSRRVTLHLCLRHSIIGSFLIEKGMLASTETIRVVARALQEHHVMVTVVDPVRTTRN
jgi:hypothetical protein